MKRKPRVRCKVGAFGARILELRLAKGLTQSALAKQLDLHETAVSHWERGDAFPGIETLTTVAAFFGMTVAELIEGERSYAALAQLIEAKAS